jgi:hypothetical protein
LEIAHEIRNIAAYMNTLVWREGVSRGSIGRFGGFRDDCIPYNNGYLHLSATATDLYLEEYDERPHDLGHLRIPRDHRLKTDRNWTSARYDFSHGDGRPCCTVTRSLLFPGFHHRVHGSFEYYWRLRGFGATSMFLPLKKGIVHREAVHGYDPKRDGPLARPWILFTFAESAMPFDYPMLFALDRQPTGLEVWSHEYLKIRFGDERRAATVVQIHPFGASRLDKAETVEWKKRLPASVERKMDFWAAAAMAYPHQCVESFAIDEKRGTVRIRDEYRYLRSKNAWGVEPIALAPLPPVLANARDCGHPVAVRGTLLEKLCPTFNGFYEAVRGESVEYTLPLSRYRNHTLAPVAVKNHPLGTTLTRKLTDTLTSGQYLTFGGDDHYDATTSIDSLHDLRIMAWALWSIAPEKRAQVIQQLTRGLHNFADHEFMDYQTAPHGVPWARHRTVFDYLGEIDYDYEWYNGMHLAGLWSWAYFVQDPKTDQFLRGRWGLVQRLMNYMTAYNDWALVAPWTCARGEAMWLDGINYAYEGMLGHAALARRLGKQAEAEYSDYLAAKTEALLVRSWRDTRYIMEQFPNLKRKEAMQNGYFEGRPPRSEDDDDWSCGTYGYQVRDLTMLQADIGGADAVRRARRPFRKAFPKWLTDPYSYGKANNYPGSDVRRTVHHYFLDPRLITLALVAGDDIRPLIKEIKVPLTGPVLESFLVSLAPRVLVPRDVRFGGVTWDHRRKTLTVNLDGQGRTSVAFPNDRLPRDASPQPLKIERRGGYDHYHVGLSGPTTMVFQF